MNSTKSTQERLMPILITKEGIFTPTAHKNSNKKSRPRKTPTDRTTPQMLTIREVAEKSGLSEYLIRRLCKENMRFSELVEEYFRLYAPNNLKPITAYNYQKHIDYHFMGYFGRVFRLTMGRYRF